MKKALLALLCGALFGTGCAIEIGNGHKGAPTVGQQLVDLKKAKDAGAISDAEYEKQKMALLGTK